MKQDILWGFEGPHSSSSFFFIAVLLHFYTAQSYKVSNFSIFIEFSLNLQSYPTPIHHFIRTQDTMGWSDYSAVPYHTDPYSHIAGTFRRRPLY